MTDSGDKSSVALLRARLHAAGQVEGSPVVKAVLFAIVAHTDDEGCARPSVRRIAQYAGISRRSVQTSINTLERGDVLRTKRTRGGPKNTNDFYLTLPANGAPPAPSERAQRRTTSAVPPETRAHHQRRYSPNGAVGAPLGAQQRTGSAVTGEASPKQGRSTSAVGGHNGAPPAPLEPYSGSISAPPAQEDKKEERERERERKKESARALRFDEFWSAWPSHKRKADRKKCLAVWTRQDLDAKADEIISKVEAWKLSDDWTKDDGDYVPAPLTWLNQERWEAPAGKRARRAKSPANYAEGAW